MVLITVIPGEFCAILSPDIKKTVAAARSELILPSGIKAANEQQDEATGRVSLQNE